MELLKYISLWDWDEYWFLWTSRVFTFSPLIHSVSLQSSHNLFWCQRAASILVNRHKKWRKLHLVWKWKHVKIPWKINAVLIFLNCVCFVFCFLSCRFDFPSSLGWLMEPCEAWSQSNEMFSVRELEAKSLDLKFKVKSFFYHQRCKNLQALSTLELWKIQALKTESVRR